MYLQQSQANSAAASFHYQQFLLYYFMCINTERARPAKERGEELQEAQKQANCI